MEGREKEKNKISTICDSKYDVWSANHRNVT